MGGQCAQQNAGRYQKHFAVKQNSDSSAEGMVTYSRNPKLKDPDPSYFLQPVTQKGVDGEREDGAFRKAELSPAAVVCMQKQCCLEILVDYNRQKID